MSLIETKKTPLVALPFLKKRLRRITALGLRKLDIKDFNFAVYFTLHRTEKTVAFYTSEAIENQRSPEWSYLKFPFRVQCLEEFFMRVWIKCGNECRPFLEYDIHLDQSLLPDEQKDESTQSNNSLWLEMFGYRFSDDEANEPKIGPIPQPTTTTNGGGGGGKKSNTKRVQFLKSYTSLSIQRMMSSLQSIRKEKIESKDCLDKLQTLVNTNDEFLSKIKERETRQLFIERLREYLQCQTTAHDQRLQMHQQRQETINDRKIRLSQNLMELLNQQEELKSRTESVKQSKLTLYDLMQLILYRQKSIVRDIYTYVYPITVQNKNEYTIANIKLPPAEDKIFQTSLNREKLYEVEAAVGFCAHLVLIISQFIQLPLRFPIECYGTPTVKIHDHTLTSTNFSLDFSSKNEVFPYAFFLLNRNIGQILEHFHIGNRNTDYRRTLENLKEILDRCFVPSTTNHKLEPKSPNLPMSNEIPIPIHKFSNLDRSNTRSSRTSTLTPVFRSLNSSSSSLAESNNFDQSEQTDREIELYPRSNTISPRLTMQFSVMQQK